MSKFTVKATALAIASVCGSAAYAGSITSPAADSNATVYAAEALAATTDLTLPAIAYTMGVGRTTAQGFTIIATPSSGAAFTTASCTTGIPVVSGAGAATITVKRASGSECAYDVNVTTALTTSSILTFTGLVLDSHTLNVAGNSASVSLNLWDSGETARIDNTAAVTRKVATAVQAVNVYAAAADTATTADVNATAGPLKGFVAGGAGVADTATIAKANLTFDNNSANAKAADGTTNFDFTGTTGTVAITLTGTTSGVKANSFCIDLDADSTLCETGEKFTVTSTAGTLSGIASTTFPAQGSTTTKTVTFEADGTTSLGTSRTFAVTGTVTPQVGAAEALADTASKNATWWTWTANASQLMVPYMTTNGKYVSRFSLLNTGSSDVNYTVTCYGDVTGATTSTATNGAGGTLKAGKSTTVLAADTCTFSDATIPRGGVVFTINAPINTVKGSYAVVDAATGANGFLPMVRPYNSANTTE